MTHVTFGPFHPHLEGRFLDTLLDLKKDDPFGEILVITPTRALSHRLMSLLAHERPLLGVRFSTFLTFAYEIIRRAGETLPPVSNRAVTRLLLADAGAECTDPEGRYSDLFRFDGYTSALISLFSRMTSHLIDPAKVDTPSDLERLVLDICARHRGKKREMSIYDTEDRVFRALEILSAGEQIETPTTTLLYGFYDLNPLQREIVTRLSSRGELFIFSPAIPGEEASAYAEETSRLFDHISSEPPTILSRESTLLSPGPSPVAIRPPAPGASVRVVSASGIVGEAQAAARGILEIKEERPDLPWRDIGVVTLDPMSSPLHLEEAFRRYSIPAYFDRGFPLTRSPMTAACLTLFGLTRNRPARAEVTTLLSSRFFTWPGLDPEDEQWVRDHSHLAEVIARDAGIVHGLEPFRDAWDQASRDALPGIPGEDEEDPDASRIRGLCARFARATRDVTDRLIDDISSLPPSDDPTSYAEGFSALLQTYIRHEPEDEQVYTALSGIIDEMAGISAVRKNIPLADFVSLVSESIEETILPDRSGQDGVFVGDLMSIRGLSFDVMIVTGMNGGVFPRKGIADPLLGEATREKLGLPTFRSLYPEDLFLFSLAMEAARGELVLFYRRSDDKGRTAIPSIVLDRIMAGDLTGTPIPPEPAPRYAALDLFCARYTEKDLRTAHLLEAFRTGRIDPARAVVLSSPSLSRGIEAMDHKPLFGPYGIYDGVIGPRDELQEATRRLSPRRLEVFALCPFRFFMEYILETGAVEEPELPVDMDRDEIGSAYHRILYRLFSALNRENLLPISDSTVEDARRRLFPIIDDELSHRMGPIPALVERARREFITDSLIETLAHEADRESGGVVPRFFEWRFGFLPSEYNEETTPPLILETPSGTVEITGKVDRIDEDTEHRIFEVVDYKSGRPSKPKLDKRIQKGLSLQLPLYLLATRDVLFSGDFTPTGASLINLEQPIGPDKEERLDLGDSPDILDAALLHIHRFVEMMRRGVFFPAGVEPDKGCRFCDHRNHCRSRSKDIAQIKKHKTLVSLGLDGAPDEEGDIDD